MKLNFTTKISLSISISFSIILLGYLFFLNFSPLGKMTVFYNFQKTPFTKGLWPETRIKEIVCEKECRQEITGQPVYINILSPQKFTTAKCQLNYYGEDPNNFRLSLKENTSEWKFQTPTPQIIATENNNVTLETTFNLKFAEYSYGALTFSFSHKKMDEINSFQISNFRCHLNKNTPLKTLLKKVWKR